MERNGDAAIATKEEVRLSASHILQFWHSRSRGGLLPRVFVFHVVVALSQYMKLKEIMDNKNYTEFFEDEKELLWKLRAEVRDRYPESLSKLLLITKWNKREDVVQV